MAMQPHAHINSLGSPRLLQLWSGTKPAIDQAPGGTKIAEITLPSTWMAAGPSTTAVKAGTWTVPSCLATGTITFFRIVVGSTAHAQDTVSGPGGGGAMVLSSTAVITSTLQAVTVDTFVISTPANA